MAFQARSAILGEIGDELQAGVLAYVTGDRENLWAHSASTLIALGADKIFMTRFGPLSRP
jgi:hypothetical protein